MSNGERKTIAIVDYGAGNLRSIQKALEYVAGGGPGIEVRVTGDPAAVEQAAAVVLPGVGAAGATMRHLAGAGLIAPVQRAARSGRPFLGVCLGLQLLFAHHEEDDVAGLAVLPGRARRLPAGLKVPHMGWNTVHPTGAAWTAVSGPEQVLPLQTPNSHSFTPNPYYYFVHSYYVEPEAALAGAVVGTTTYGLDFCSAFVYEQIWATQFHPEKSGPAGLRLLANFVGQVAP